MTYKEILEDTRVGVHYLGMFGVYGHHVEKDMKVCGKPWKGTVQDPARPLTLRITDPCYSLEDEGTLELKAKRGSWYAFLERSIDKDYPNWGVRNSRLIAMQLNYPACSNEEMDKHPEWKGKNWRPWVFPEPVCDTKVGAIGVDSGSAGLFDTEYFKNNFDSNKDDCPWYRLCGQITCYSALQAGIIGKRGYGGGVITSSGLGDGYYPVYVQYDKNEADLVTAVEIRFMEFGEDEDDYEEDDEGNVGDVSANAQG